MVGFRNAPKFALIRRFVVSENEWMIRTADGHEYRAPSRDALVTWHTEGRLPADAWIYHPSLGQWKRLAELLPAAASRSSPTGSPARRAGGKRTAIILGGGCAALILVSVLILVGLGAAGLGAASSGSAEGGTSRPQARGHAVYVLESRCYFGNQEGGSFKVELINVSNEPISGLTLVGVIKQGSSEVLRAKQPHGAPVKPGEIVKITSSGTYTRRLFTADITYEDFLPKSRVDRMFMSSYEHELTRRNYLKAQERNEELDDQTRESLAWESWLEDGHGRKVTMIKESRDLTPEQRAFVEGARERQEAAERAARDIANRPNVEETINSLLKLGNDIGLNRHGWDQTVGIFKDGWGRPIKYCTSGEMIFLASAGMDGAYQWEADDTTLRPAVTMTDGVFYPTSRCAGTMNVASDADDVVYFAGPDGVGFLKTRMIPSNIDAMVSAVNVLDLRRPEEHRIAALASVDRMEAAIAAFETFFKVHGRYPKNSEDGRGGIAPPDATELPPDVLMDGWGRQMYYKDWQEGYRLIASMPGDGYFEPEATINGMDAKQTRRALERLPYTRRAGVMYKHKLTFTGGWHVSG
jgi:hypothetical protein